MSEAVPVNYAKLGGFVVGGVVLGLVVLAYLGVRTGKKDTFDVVSYFDESVQGLEVGAPVKARGAKVGQVSKIDIAPDKRRIEVVCELDRALLRRLGVTPPAAGPTGVVKVERKDLRFQLSQIGIAGTLFVNLDIVDPQRYPPPKLSFETPPNYVPAVPSTIKDLTEQLHEALERFPEVAERVESLLAKAEAKIDVLDIAAVASDVRTFLTTADAVIAPLQVATDASGHQTGLGPTIAAIQSSAEGARENLARLPETIDQLREAARGIRVLAVQVRRLAETSQGDAEALQDTLRSLKALADLLEHDPGALLRGKAAPAPPDKEEP